MYIFVAAAKSETKEALKAVLEKCRILKHLICKFLSDNGSEFTSNHKIVAGSSPEIRNHSAIHSTIHA